MSNMNLNNMVWYVTKQLKGTDRRWNYGAVNSDIISLCASLANDCAAIPDEEAYVFEPYNDEEYILVSSNETKIVKNEWSAERKPTAKTVPAASAPVVKIVPASDKTETEKGELIERAAKSGESLLIALKRAFPGIDTIKSVASRVIDIDINKYVGSADAAWFGVLSQASNEGKLSRLRRSALGDCPNTLWVQTRDAFLVHERNVVEQLAQRLAAHLAKQFATTSSLNMISEAAGMDRHDAFPSMDIYSRWKLCLEVASSQSKIQNLRTAAMTALPGDSLMAEAFRTYETAHEA